MDTERTIKFINLVQARPILYNKRSGSYKRSDLKAKKWHEIAVEMGFQDDDAAMKKWKYLRDKFVRIKREGKYTPSGTGAEDQDLAEWPLYPYMEFLSEYVTQRRHYTNVTHREEQTVSNDCETIIFDVETEEMECDIVQEDEVCQDTPGIWRSASPGSSRSKTLGTSQSETPGTSQSETLATSRSEIPETSRSGTPGTSRSGTPGTSRSGTPGTSRSGTPETSRSSRNSEKSRTLVDSDVNSSVENAIINVGTYFAKKSADDSDSAFCNYLAAELKEMSRGRKNQLKKMIVNFVTNNDEDH